MTDTSTDADRDAVDQLRAHRLVHVPRTDLPADQRMDRAARYALRALDTDMVGEIIIDPRSDTNGYDGYYWPDGLITLDPSRADDLAHLLAHEVSHGLYADICRQADLSAAAWRDARLLSVEHRGVPYDDYRASDKELFCDALASLVTDPADVRQEYPAFHRDVRRTLSGAGMYHVLPRGVRRKSRVHGILSRVMAVVG